MKLYFSGIGGIGMSALAQISFLLNNITLGSDLRKTYITEKLEQMGIKIFYNQSEENIAPDIDLFIYSSAITKNNPEYRKAEELKIPILHRSEYLNSILKNKKVVAITGSSGKTTTTTLTGIALNKLQIKSNLITGGWIKEINSNTIWNNSELVVLEADESDGSLVNYPSNIGLITDLAVDVNLNSPKFKQAHFENLQNKLKEVYQEFIQKIITNHGKLIISNDKDLVAFINSLNLKPNIIFGNEKKYFDTQYFDIPYLFFENLSQYENEGYPFVKFNLKAVINGKEELIGQVILNTLGEYNAFNFTASASIVFSITESIQKLQTMCKLSPELYFTKRRFEILFNQILDNNRLIIVDDYAHNPKKIKFLLDNLNYVYKKYQRVIVFQPHRYTRTMMFWETLKTVFNNINYLIILPIYEAGEKPIYGISSENLVENIKKQKNNLENVLYIETFEQTIKFLDKIVRSKDSIVVFVGAGNITNLANDFASKFITSKV